MPLSSIPDKSDAASSDNDAHTALDSNSDDTDSSMGAATTDTPTVLTSDASSDAESGNIDTETEKATGSSSDTNTTLATALETAVESDTAEFDGMETTTASAPLTDGGSMHDAGDDSDSTVETEHATDTCLSGIAHHVGCDDDGNVSSFDECGNIVAVIEECESQHGACWDGVCGCEEGYTGETCGECVIYVDDDADENIDNDGRSWAQSLRRLEDAISIAAGLHCTSVWVAAGTYVPSTEDNVDTFQLVSNVALYGGFSGNEHFLKERDPVLHKTVLSGDVLGDDGENFENYEDNVNHVVRGADSTALDGFTITGGNAETTGGGMLNIGVSPNVRNCIFEKNRAAANGGGMANLEAAAPTITDSAFISNSGGGIFNELSSSTITNCSFVENVSTQGGGISNETASPTITDCTFSGNHASSIGGGMYNYDASPQITNCTFSENTATGSGGGVYSYGGVPTLSGCTFSDNSASSGGGAFISSSSPNISECSFSGNSANNGGGIYNEMGSDPTLVTCTFTENHAGENGGGMYNMEGSSPVVVNSTFTGNSAKRGGGLFNMIDGTHPQLINCAFVENDASDDGGGICNASLGESSVFNCIFTKNRAGSYGGGICNYGGVSNVTNCTFVGNHAGYFGGGVFIDMSEVSTIINSILWANDSDSSYSYDNQISADFGLVASSVSYSNIQGGCANALGSMCGDGNINASPRFVNEENGNFVLSQDSPCLDVGYNAALPPDEHDFDDDENTGESLSLDMAGLQRTVDGNNDGAATVDMGAYEYHP